MATSVAPSVNLNHVQDQVLAGVLRGMYQTLAEAINKLGMGVASGSSQSTITEAMVQGLVADLAAKAALNSPVLVRPNISDFTNSQHDHSIASKGGFISPLALNGLNVQINQLGADVPLTSANAYYDGPTLTLPAGTWEVQGAVQVTVTQVCTVSTKLWDGGSNVYASGGWTGGGNGYEGIISLFGTSIPGPATIKISATCNYTGSSIRAAVPVNGAGNNASYLMAKQIG